MLIAQITDTHIRVPGRLAYRKVDTAPMLETCVAALLELDPQPDIIVHTGDLVDFGLPEEYARFKEIVAPLTVPIFAVPGNHDERDAMRLAFSGSGYLPKESFLNYAVDLGPLRLVALDTVVPGQGGGSLCAERLAWLDDTLAEKPETPTLVLMHHPPFITGIAHMDRIGLEGREGFAAVVRRHAHVEAILCGHVHRPTFTKVGGRSAMICPSPAHQVALDLRPGGPSAFRMEPPGYMLHRLHDGQLVSHVAVLGEWAGPFPFFDTDGNLID